MDKLKSLYILPIIALLLLFSFNCLAQQKKDKISTLEEQLKAVNFLKNTKPDSAFIIVSNLITQAHVAQLPIQEAKGLLIKGVILYNKDENNQAFTIFNQALTLFQKADDKLGMAKAYNNLGGVSGALNDSEKAFYYQQKALDIRIAINDPLLASSYNMIGNLYLNKGNYPQAIDYYLKGLPISEKNNDKYAQSSLLNNIALVYWKQNRYNEAFNYTSKCLALERQENDYKGMAGSYNNLAGIRMDQNNLDDAFNLSKEAIKYAEKVNFTKELARANSVLGQIAFQKKNYQEAVYYGSAGLAQRRKIGRNNDIATSLNNLSQIYVALADYDEAEKLCLEGIQLSEKNSYLNLQESFYNILGDIYSKKGNWQRAYSSNLKHEQIKDSIFNESNSKIIFDLQAKYETSKKQHQIVILNKENNIKTLQLKNNELELLQNNYLITQQKQALDIGDLQLKNAAQKLQNKQLDIDKRDLDIKLLSDKYKIQQLSIANRNFLIAIILIIATACSVILYFLYNRYKIRNNALLQQEIYKQQEIESKALFDGEQNERIRIARDLHDGVGQMLSLVKMNLSSLDKNAIPEKTLILVDKTIDEVRNVSHNLMPEELNFGIFSALENLTEKVNASGNTKMKIEIAEEIRNLKFTKQNELSIYRVVQEVVNNMIKHARASIIMLLVKQIENSIIIIIKDDGQGMENGSIDNSEGIGWKNINARVLLLNGKINVQSEKLSGTQIEITLPKDGK